MTIAQTIANLYNGVSQQPHALRSPSQADEQINADGTSARGLNKRMPTQFIHKASLTPFGNCHVHFVDRSPTDKYFLVLLNGQAYTIDSVLGTAALVTYLDENGIVMAAPPYMNASDPRSAFRCLTVGETTFVVNREVTVATTTSVTGGYTYTDVQQFSDLPGTPAAMTIYRVLGAGGDSFTSYYVKGGAGTTYIETRREDSVKLLDRGTMPMRLVRLSQYSFALQRVKYDYRLVGDETSCPPPEFVGRQIRDVFFHRNRLGFLTASSITMSRAGEYFSFYPRSMTQVADDDPIDETLAHPKAPTLNHAVTFNKALLIFGDTVQFTAEGGDVLSPRSFAVNPVTEFDCSQTAKPIGLGSNVYFTQPVTNASRIREFFVAKDKVSSDAFDVTAHCPSYVPANVTHMAVSAAENMLAVLTAPESDALYIYRVMFDEGGEKRLQSSWSRWTFYGQANARVITGIGISNAAIYLLFDGADGAFLEKLDIVSAPNLVTDGEGNRWPIMLDRQFIAGVFTAVNYDPVNDWTTFDLPYEWDVSWAVIGVRRNGPDAGKVLNFTRPTATTARAPGDWVTYETVVGVPYMMAYRLSQVFLRSEKGEPRVGGRLQITGLRMMFRKSGNFTLRISPFKRPPVDRNWRPSATSLTITGTSAVRDGNVRMAVNSDASTVKLELLNDSPLPSSFHAVEWDGVYATKVKKV